MGEHAEQDRIERCPRCLYALRGLPVEHRCPECGLAIDREWRVFGGKLTRPRSARAMRVAFSFPLVLLGCGFVGSVFALLLGPAWLAGWIQVVSLGGVAGLLGWLLCSKAKRFIAVGPRGLAVYHSPNRFDHYAWERIGRARYNLVRKSVDIEVDGRLLRIGAFLFFRGNVFEADECVRSINAYPRPPTTKTAEEANGERDPEKTA